jgi:hypothetical protein
MLPYLDPLLAERAEQQQVLDSFSDIVEWLNTKPYTEVPLPKLQEAINTLFVAITAQQK